MQNNQNWAFMIILDYFKPLWWEKIEEKNGKTKLKHSESFLTTLVGKDGEKCEMIKIGHSESFQTSLVEKDEKRYRTTKIGYAK